MPPEISPLALLAWDGRRKAIASKTSPYEAQEWLAAHAPEAVRRVLQKTAIGAGSTTDSTLGGEGTSIALFSDTLRTKSIFFRLMSDSAFARTPFHVRAGVVTGTAAGAAVAEGASVPVGKITLNNVLLLPQKACALIVVTDELLRNLSSAGQSLFSRELAGAIAESVDLAFLSSVASGITPITSAGTSATNAKHDLRTALLQVSGIGSEKLYWCAAVDVAKKASALDAAGLDAFPAMSAAGGEMAALPCLVSSGIPAGNLYLLDGSQIAADATAPTIQASTESDILMDSTPSGSSAVPTPGTMVSMFQTDSTALMATCWFGAQRLRTSAVAVVNSINWGGP